MWQMSDLYKSSKRSKVKKHNHVFRFLHYVTGFNLTVHPSSPDRFPEYGLFKCTEGNCTATKVCKIKHRV